MSEGAREIIERFTARNYAPALQRVEGSYRFDIEGVGTWHIAVKHGAIAATQERLEADCVIECDEATFLRIIHGQQNLVTSAMRGEVRVTGNLALAQIFHGLLPAPLHGAVARKEAEGASRGAGAGGTGIGGPGR